MGTQDLKVFSLHSGRSFGARVAEKLGQDLAEHEEREFEWGHHKSRSLESVRGKDVYVVQSLHGDAVQSVNDKLCRLLFFLGALKDAGTGRLTAVMPFLCYSRKDQQTQPRDPTTTRYVARCFEAVGVDRVVTLDVHNLAAFQNAFRCETVHLDARGLFVEFFGDRLASRDVTIVSPDLGGIKRAQRYREVLQRRLGKDVAFGCVEKRRSQDVVSGDTIVGEVQDRTVLLFDDMICGGTTLARAATACREAGAKAIMVAATHGAFVPSASETLGEAPIAQIAILDHIPPSALDDTLAKERLRIVEGAGLFAQTIRRLHDGESLVELHEGA